MVKRKTLCRLLQVITSNLLHTNYFNKKTRSFNQLIRQIVVFMS